MDGGNNKKKYKDLVKVNDYWVNKDYRNTMISSRHHPIIRNLANATDERILEIKGQYEKYEENYNEPVNKVKRLVQKVLKK